MLRDIFYLSFLLNFFKPAGVLLILVKLVSPQVHRFVLVEEPRVLLLLNSESIVLKGACAFLL